MKVFKIILILVMISLIIGGLVWVSQPKIKHKKRKELSGDTSFDNIIDLPIRYDPRLVVLMSTIRIGGRDVKAIIDSGSDDLVVTSFKQQIPSSIDTGDTKAIQFGSEKAQGRILSDNIKPFDNNLNYVFGSCDQSECPNILGMTPSTDGISFMESLHKQGYEPVYTINFIIDKMTIGSIPRNMNWIPLVGLDTDTDIEHLFVKCDGMYMNGQLLENSPKYIMVDTGNSGAISGGSALMNELKQNDQYDITLMMSQFPLKFSIVPNDFSTEWSKTKGGYVLDGASVRNWLDSQFGGQVMILGLTALFNYTMAVDFRNSRLGFKQA